MRVVRGHKYDLWQVMRHLRGEFCDHAKTIEIRHADIKKQHVGTLRDHSVHCGAAIRTQAHHLDHGIGPAAIAIDGIDVGVKVGTSQLLIVSQYNAQDAIMRWPGLRATPRLRRWHSGGGCAVGRPCLTHARYSSEMVTAAASAVGVRGRRMSMRVPPPRRACVVILAVLPYIARRRTDALVKPTPKPRGESAS